MLFVRELGLQRVTGAAGAVALRVAGLRHEPVDHAMEYYPVIKPLAHQPLDLGAGGRRQIGPQLDDDAPCGNVQVNRILQICSHRLTSENESGDEHEEPTQRCHDLSLPMSLATLAEAALPRKQSGRSLGRPPLVPAAAPEAVE